ADSAAIIRQPARIPLRLKAKPAYSGSMIPIARQFPLPRTGHPIAQRKNQSTALHLVKMFSRFSLIAAIFVSLTSYARAAELVVFEQAGCVWCEAFDNEIGAIYDKTDVGLRAPLRRVDIMQAPPGDLTFIHVERLTPLFVLVDKDRGIGRIRGYGGREMFW